jgi:hypothetical protein
VRASSEVETRLRGRPALQRGGDSPEGVAGPRARQRLTRGGDEPLSEEKPYKHGAVPLEQSRVPPEGGWGRLFWWAAEAPRTASPC